MSSCPSPEAALLSGHLGLSVELIGCRESHEEVDYHQVVVYGCDLSGVAGPYESCPKDSDLLICGNVLSWFLEVSNICHCDHPLEGRGPEEDCEGSSRVQ